MAKNAQNSRIEFTDLISLSGNLARYSPTGRDSRTAIGRPDGQDSPLIPDKKADYLQLHIQIKLLLELLIRSLYRKGIKMILIG